MVGGGGGGGGGIAAKVTEEWSNQTLCQVNDCVVRLGYSRKVSFIGINTDREDEFFFVLEGRFVIELENEKVALLTH